MSASLSISGRGRERSIAASWSGIPAARWLELRLFWYVTDRSAALPARAPGWRLRTSARRYILFRQTVRVHRLRAPRPDGALTLAMELPAAPRSGAVSRGHIHWAVELVVLRSRWRAPELLARQPAEGLPEPDARE